MDALTEMPSSFPAGTTVKYTRTLTDYPASSGWVLTLTLAGPSVLTVTAAASGSAHAVTLTATQTAQLAAGVYRWAESVTKADEVYRVASGQVGVDPNLDAAGAGDLQSDNEKLLAAVTAMINVRTGVSGDTPKDVEAYSIDGITVTKVPLDRLLTARNSLAVAVARERRGGTFGRQHRVTFTGASNE